MEVSGQLHTTGKSLWFLLDRRLDGLRISLDVVMKRKCPCPY
jgi:hypothetical protein